MKRIIAVDLFCGAGGASTGLLRAAKEFGVEVELLAINHWPQAVETHLLNHPYVRHKCEAIERINPREEVPGGRVNILLAGPECTHHSTAAGGRPINDQSRATAWCVVKWAQELYIDSIIIENVPNFMSWGPLGANGKPLKSKKGQTFDAYINAFRSLDYRVEVRKICCADYGDPTTRERLFILCQRGVNRVHFPLPTHSRTGGATLFGPTQKWVGAKEIIDWSIPGKSIFGQKKPLARATMARILAGLEKFGGPELKPFIVKLRGGEPSHLDASASSIEAPIPTLSAQGTHLGLAEPFLVSNNTNNQPKALDEPVGTVTGGNRHYLTEPFIVPVNHGEESGHRARSVEEPLPTLTGRANQYLVQPFVMGQQSGSVPRSTDDPLPTIATDGAIQVVEPFLVPHYGERQGQEPRTHSVQDPVPTIPATGSGKFELVQAFVLSAGGAKVDARSTEEPLPTVLGYDRLAVAEPFIVQTSHGQRLHDTEKPLPTITTARGGDFGVVQPVLIQTSERRRESATPIDEPVHTITAHGGRCIGLAEPILVSVAHGDNPTISATGRDYALAEPFLVRYHGSHEGREDGAQRVHDVADPLPTLDTSNRYAVAEPFITKFYGTAKSAQSVREPLDTITAKDRFALVQPVIDGYALDIRFRMLQPHELAAATSFPPEYQFTGTREDVVKQIGNAWPGKTAKALCMELLRPYAEKARRAAAWRKERTA